jgi:hypothetical protein
MNIHGILYHLPGLRRHPLLKKMDDSIKVQKMLNPTRTLRICLEKQHVVISKKKVAPLTSGVEGATMIRWSLDDKL